MARPKHPLAPRERGRVRAVLASILAAMLLFGSGQAAFAAPATPEVNASAGFPTTVDTDAGDATGANTAGDDATGADTDAGDETGANTAADDSTREDTSAGDAPALQPSESEALAAATTDVDETTPEATTPAASGPTITTSSLPSAVVETPYSGFISATGEPAPTFAVTGGALPPSLSLAPSGQLTGTPTASGSFSFTVTATNDDGSSSSSFVINVADKEEVETPPAFISAPNLPTATVGVAMDVALQATGKPAPTYRQSGGALPGGVRLDPATGHLSGTPTFAGEFTFSVTAANSTGSASIDVQLTVTDPAGGDQPGTTGPGQTEPDATPSPSAPPSATDGTDVATEGQPDQTTDPGTPGANADGGGTPAGGNDASSDGGNSGDTGGDDDGSENGGESANGWLEVTDNVGIPLAIVMIAVLLAIGGFVYFTRRLAAKKQ